MTDFLSKEKENDIYQSPIKVVSLFILQIVSAFVMSFYFRQLLINAASQNLIWFLVGLVLFIVFSFLTALFVSGFMWSSLAAGLAVAVSLTVFYDYFSTTLLVFGLFIFLIFVWGVHNLRSELENTLKIKFSRLAKVFLPNVSLGVAILISLFCYFLLYTRSSFPISFENFQFLLKPNEKLIGILIKDFSFQKPLQTVLTGLLEPQLVEKIPNYKSLSASAKSIILEEAVRQNFLSGLEKFLGTKINPQDSVERVIYDSLKIKFSQLSETPKNWIIIGLFIVLFLVIRILFIPLNWLLSLLIFLIYLLLLAFNFASIRLESRSKEVLVI